MVSSEKIIDDNGDMKKSFHRNYVIMIIRARLRPPLVRVGVLFPEYPTSRPPLDYACLQQQQSAFFIEEGQLETEFRSFAVPDFTTRSSVP